MKHVYAGLSYWEQPPWWKIEHGLSDQTHSFSLLVISNDVLDNSIYARWKEH